MITISDVQEILGSTNSSLGGLCLDPTINPWSKWKPIRSDSNVMTLEELKEKNYGITFLWDRTLTGLLSKVQENNNIGYSYDKPVFHFRLGDFRNYNHTAPCPVMAAFSDDDVVKIGGLDSDYKVPIMGLESPDIEDSDETTYLSKSLIYPEGVTNRGALITDGTNTSWSVGNIPWGNTYWQRFKGQECTVMEFMCNLPEDTSIVNHVASVNDLYYAIPESIHTITVSSEAPSGSKDVFIETGFTGGGIMFGGVGYDTVTYSFKFSSIGDVYRGGTLSNIWIGLYSDPDCINIITQKQLNSGNPLTIGNEEESQLFFGSLSNTTGEAIVYLGIFWNNKLQWKIVPMASPDLPDQISEE